MALLNFDATNVAPDTGAMEAIPAGWYNTIIDESDIKPTKDGAGHYLQLRFNILDGQYAGRKLFTRLNLQNANPQTVEIAFRQLSAIAHAVGVLQVADSSALHGRPLRVKASYKAADGNYEASNELRGFKNINDVESGPALAAPQGGGFPQPQFQQPQPQQQQPAPGGPPWGAPQQQVAAPAPIAPPAGVAAPGAPWQQPSAPQPWQQQAPQQQQPQAAQPQFQPQPQQQPQQPQAPQQPAFGSGQQPPWAQPK